MEMSLQQHKEEIERLDITVKEERRHWVEERFEREKEVEKQRESAATRLQASFRSLR